VHCFNYAATLSQGAGTGDIPQISDGAQRLARGLAAVFLAEDVEHHHEAMQRYAEPELLGDEWTEAALPPYEPAPGEPEPARRRAGCCAASGRRCSWCWR
jgi:cation diffusion facilitator CzcD-associated flavoprotein CzcO